MIISKESEKKKVFYPFNHSPNKYLLVLCAKHCSKDWKKKIPASMKFVFQWKYK